MKYTVETIPHSKQRYPTPGDWITDKGGQLKRVIVSDMGNPDFEFLCAIHEAVEAYLCITRGIKQSQLDRFDMEYEAARKPGDMSEPGNSKKAPYHREHLFATMVEKLVSEELGVDWDAYGEACDSL